ncbi:unnamed protein product [Polarella glacialis]|uniref:Uncharacterized protein n=1 Tax=Polarella glacialis TaxID=89957 RepID=A0A813LAS3_POLGL|nr:unnamed protein product [Polarella glacialis]
MHDSATLSLHRDELQASPKDQPSSANFSTASVDASAVSLVNTTLTANATVQANTISPAIATTSANDTFLLHAPTSSPAIATTSANGTFLHAPTMSPAIATTSANDTFLHAPTQNSQSPIINNLWNDNDSFSAWLDSVWNEAKKCEPGIKILYLFSGKVRKDDGLQGTEILSLPENLPSLSVRPRTCQTL